MNVPLLGVEHHWVCPNCDQTHLTRDPRPHTPFHTCAGLRGLTAPFIAEGVRCKVEALDREDYAGTDIAQADADGRVKMSVVTTRDDGQDCAVLAPTAVVSGRS